MMLHLDKRRSASILLLVSFAWLINAERHTFATLDTHETSPVTLVAACTDDAILVSAPMGRESTPLSIPSPSADFWRAALCCMFEQPNIALVVGRCIHDRSLLHSHLLYTQTTSSDL